LPLLRSEQTDERSDLAVAPNVAGIRDRADLHSAPAACSSAPLGAPAAGVVAAGVVVAGLVDAGVVFAGAVFFGVVDAGLFDEPQPATSTALATATSNGEYSLRVIFSPFGVSFAGLARLPRGI
jgi:hypothetical protein